MKNSIKESQEQEFTGWVTVHLSPNHIFSAFHLANVSRQIEKLGNKSDKVLILQHRSFVVGSIISSVSFLESVINEFFSSPQKLAPELKERLSAVWMIENFRRTARTLEKFQSALQLAEKSQFDKGANPYQDAKSVIDLRNALIHFIPETKPTLSKPGVEVPLDDFGKQLRGKFNENPLLQEISTSFSVQDEHGATIHDTGFRVHASPFFPEACLSAGCARWAAQSVLNLADDFFRKLNLQGHYEYVREHLTIEES